MHHHGTCSSGPVLPSPKQIFYPAQMPNATPKPLSHAAQTANAAERQPWISAAPPLSSSHGEKHQNRAGICFWPPSGVLIFLCFRKGKGNLPLLTWILYIHFLFLQWHENQTFLKYCYSTLIALTFALAARLELVWFVPSSDNMLGDQISAFLKGLSICKFRSPNTSPFGNHYYICCSERSLGLAENYYCKWASNYKVSQGIAAFLRAREVVVGEAVKVFQFMATF